MTIGHKNKPLGDWDVLALEDVSKFQIEQKNKRMLQKKRQSEMAAFYDKQKEQRQQNDAIDKDFYHTRQKKSDGQFAKPSNVRLTFPADFNNNEIKQQIKKVNYNSVKSQIKFNEFSSSVNK